MPTGPSHSGGSSSGGSYSGGSSSGGSYSGGSSSGGGNHYYGGGGGEIEPLQGGIILSSLGLVLAIIPTVLINSAIVRVLCLCIIGLFITIIVSLSVKLSVYTERKLHKTQKILWASFGLYVSLVFVLFSVFVFLGQHVGEMLLIRQDAREYGEIIQYARDGEDGYYLITIEDIFLSGFSSGGDGVYYSLRGNHNSSFTAHGYINRNGVLYFYLAYSFRDDDNRYISGESYTAYSENAVRGLTQMEFAYTLNYDNDGSWDCIDVNYSLNSNMDYAVARESVIRGTIFALLSSGVGAFFIYVIIRIAKNKKVFYRKPQLDNTVNEKTNTNESSYKVCKYCGNSIGQNDKTCSSCGARLFYWEDRTGKSNKK